ncbi:hypothetical protein ACNKU7_08940 [Microbulbifer sp. SA54]|uniref:hypothetical protein n=1 Tax=Microbulbifer sp. SA54 TaxID=3401577 RepID=UPI003AAA2428
MYKSSFTAFFLNFLAAPIAFSGDAVLHTKVSALQSGQGLAGIVWSSCRPDSSCSGTTFAFRAQLCLFPADRTGFFYAINADNEQADYELFNLLFIEHLKLGSPDKAATTQQSVSLAGYTGLYV